MHDTQRRNYQDKLIRILAAASSGAQADANRYTSSIEYRISAAKDGVHHSGGNSAKATFQEWMAEQEGEAAEWERALHEVLSMLKYPGSTEEK